MSAALILLMVAASTGSFGLISGAEWWFAMVGTASLMIVVAAGLRTIGTARWLVPVLCSAVLLGLLTVAFGGGTGIGGVVPTPATFGGFGELLMRARLSIEQQATPAQSLPEFLFLIALAAGVAAILLDVCSNVARVPALCAAVVGVVLLAPSLLLSSGVSPLSLVACIAAFLFVLRTDTRERRRGWGETGVSLSIAAATTVVAMLIGTTAPGFAQVGRQGIPDSGISIGGGVNPLIDLGQDLRRPVAVPVLQYTTTAKTPPYLRMTSLDQFTGTIWRHRPGETNRVPSDNSIGPPPGLSDVIKATHVRTAIQVQNMESGWIPAPYPVIGVHGLAGEWKWNPNDLTIAGVDVSTQGQSYTAETLALEPTVQQLEDAGSFVPPSVSRDLFIPFDAPKIITDTAKKVTAGATNAYEKAVDLQNYFQYGGFNYSTVAPVRNSYDGDSMQSIAAFLKVKSGYCVHFASAMAVMARTLGIPARIAMGYLPGSVTGTRDNKPLLQVTSDELHAWPELYFSGVGWVPFEPTVSRGTLPAYSIPGGDVGADQSSAAPAPQRTNAIAPPTDPTNAAPGSVNTAGQELGSIISTVAALLFAVALLLTPAGVRRGLRMSRLRKLADEWGSPRLAWKELQQTARDLGMAVADTETPRSFAARVAGVLGEDETAISALQSLLEATEREEYGRPGHGIVDPDRAAQLLAVLKAMLREAGRGERIRAFLVPVSLLPTTTGILRGRARLSA
jgi:hypothetical protein